MLDISSKLLYDMLKAPAAAAWDKDAGWWMLPFPLRPEISSKEAREEMKMTAAALLAPLIDLDSQLRMGQGAASS